MKVSLIWIGKTSGDYVRLGIEEYAKRLPKYIDFSLIEIKAVKKKVSAPELKLLEGREILKAMAPFSARILLDERGKTMNSVKFSQFIERQTASPKGICFVIGGAYGFSNDVYASATGKLALSEMTFSHQLVRVVFLEQLYRACTILRGEPYHH